MQRKHGPSVGAGHKCTTVIPRWIGVRLEEGRAKSWKRVRIREHGGRAIVICVSLTPVKTNASNDEQPESAFPCPLPRRIRPWLSLP